MKKVILAIAEWLHRWSYTLLIRAMVMQDEEPQGREYLGTKIEEETEQLARPDNTVHLPRRALY